MFEVEQVLQIFSIPKLVPFESKDSNDSMYRFFGRFSKVCKPSSNGTSLWQIGHGKEGFI